MKFEDAIGLVLKYEGGYVNDPDDPGGETNFGISKRVYPNLDIKNLTLTEAVMIYRKEYWDAVRASELPEGIRLLVFDTAVNMGVGSTVRMLQLLLEQKQDGILGAKTMLSLREANPETLSRELRRLRLRRYLRLPHFPKCGEGWIARLLDVTYESGKGAA